jgi:hypothetical protein
MMKIAMSAAASGLLRELVARAGVPRDRVLLTHLRSTDWQSLTFIGERHEIGLRVPGPGSDAVVRQLCGGIEDAEFAIPGQTVADIALCGTPLRERDGATSLTIEALTIEN